MFDLYHRLALVQQLLDKVLGKQLLCLNLVYTFLLGRHETSESFQLRDVCIRSTIDLYNFIYRPYHYVC